MVALLWFSGIDGDTKMRDIGWCYVFIILGVFFAVRQITEFRKFNKKEKDKWRNGL
jgi:hypothetical protein